MSRREQHQDTYFPEGEDFFKLINKIETQCVQETESNLSTLGNQIPKCYKQLGIVLSLMYRMGCCHWGCHGKEHTIEHLVGRTVTSSMAALRLIKFGYYDEALAIIRNIDEIGNLTFLFYNKHEYIEEWRLLSDRERKNKFSPPKVREILETLKVIVPTDKERYGLLCEIGVHVTPNTTPQTYNLLGKPILGNVYQSLGLIICINELCWAVATVAAPAAKIALIDRKYAEHIFEVAIKLASLIGSIRIEVLKELKDSRK
ncbi:MAG: hypothetical protein PUP91_36505 [Rhizonema sp. PD37]|nr:hypothetical protein [Rhizonema sp. PD37]